MLELAHQVADAGAAETVKRFRKSGFAASAKGDGSPVTEADRAAERAMREVIRVRSLRLFALPCKPVMLRR
jgi:fructose-1,6-bisphosphatase/inositol monophosphatase family enzyme